MLTNKIEKRKQGKRPVSALKIQKLVEIIEEMNERPCPTDEQFSMLLGYQHASSASAIVRRALDDGLIRKIGSPRRRQLLVVKSGKRTAPAEKPGPGW